MLLLVLLLSTAIAPRAHRCRHCFLVPPWCDTRAQQPQPQQQPRAAVHALPTPLSHYGPTPTTIISPTHHEQVDGLPGLAHVHHGIGHDVSHLVSELLRQLGAQAGARHHAQLLTVGGGVNGHGHLRTVAKSRRGI